MKIVVSCLAAILLGGCVLIQFTTRVYLAGEGSSWFLYVDEPTSEMEFSKHGLFFGNLPARYRIAMPGKSGRFDSSQLTLHKSVNGGYEEQILLSGGTLSIQNCAVVIALQTNGSGVSFGGHYELPSYDCKKV